MRVRSFAVVDISNLMKIRFEFAQKAVGIRTTISLPSATVCLKGSISILPGIVKGKGHVLPSADGILAVRCLRAAAQRHEIDVTRSTDPGFGSRNIRKRGCFRRPGFLRTPTRSLHYRRRGRRRLGHKAEAGARTLDEFITKLREKPATPGKADNKAASGQAR